MLDTTLAAFLAHDARNGIVHGFVQIGRAQALRLQLVSRTHGAYQAQAVLLREFRNENLRRDGIDAVEHEINATVALFEALGIQIVERLGEHERMLGNDARVGIDIQAHSTHHVDFPATHRALERDDLAVHVARRHHIAIDEHQTAHAAAHERLDAARAHAAQSQHHDRRVRQAIHAVVAHNSTQAGIGRIVARRRLGSGAGNSVRVGVRVFGSVHMSGSFYACRIAEMNRRFFKPGHCKPRNLLNARSV